VGTAVLVRVDQHAGTAEFGLTIGERRGQGLGSEATRLVLDWAFMVMGLHNILLVTSPGTFAPSGPTARQDSGRSAGGGEPWSPTASATTRCSWMQWPMSSPTRSWPSRPRRTPKRQAIHERLMMFVRSSLPPQGRPCGRR
jgi:hypothetical protein